MLYATTSSGNEKRPPWKGRRCIFSEHPASGHAPRYDLSDEQVIVEGRGDKEVKETVD